MKDGLELMASREFKDYDEMYKIIDFLNKNLSDFNLVFGIHKEESKIIMNIYKSK